MLGQHSIWYLHIDNSCEVIRAIISWVVFFLVTLSQHSLHCLCRNWFWKWSDGLPAKSNECCWQLFRTVLSIICEQELSYQKFFWLLLGFCVFLGTVKTQNFSLQHVLCILSLCSDYLTWWTGASSFVTRLLFSFPLLCVHQLTQFCDEWGLIFWLPFSPSFHEWDVRPRWKFVHLGSHYLLPESTWMTTTCSRWSKFSHTFLSFRLCMVILAGFSWNRYEMLSMAATCFICLSRCLFGRHWCVNRTVSPLLVFFVILFAESLRIPASRHFEKKEDSYCLIYIRFLGKMCRVDLVDKTETNPVDWRHRWHVGIFEISAFSYSIWFPWMNVITRVWLRNDISNGARWNQRQQTKPEQIQQDKAKEKERNAPTEWRWL